MSPFLLIAGKFIAADSDIRSFCSWSSSLRQAPLQVLWHFNSAEDLELLLEAGPDGVQWPLDGIARRKRDHTPPSNCLEVASSFLKAKTLSLVPTKGQHPWKTTYDWCESLWMKKHFFHFWDNILNLHYSQRLKAPPNRAQDKESKRVLVLQECGQRL